MSIFAYYPSFHDCSTCPCEILQLSGCYSCLCKQHGEGKQAFHRRSQQSRSWKVGFLKSRFSNQHRNVWIDCLSKCPSLRQSPKWLWPAPTSVIAHRNTLFISWNRNSCFPSTAVTCSFIKLLEDTLPLPFPSHQGFFLLCLPQSLKP